MDYAPTSAAQQGRVDEDRHRRRLRCGQDDPRRLGVGDRAAAHRGAGDQRVRGRRRPRGGADQGDDHRGDGLRPADARPRTWCSTSSARRASAASGSCGTTCASAPSARSCWSTPPGSTSRSHPLDYFESKGLPFIVAVNQFHGVQQLRPGRGRRGAGAARARTDHQRRRARPRVGEGGPDPRHRVRAATAHRIHSLRRRTDDDRATSRTCARAARSRRPSALRARRLAWWRAAPRTTSRRRRTARPAGHQGAAPYGVRRHALRAVRVDEGRRAGRLRRRPGRRGRRSSWS